MRRKFKNSKTLGLSDLNFSSTSNDIYIHTFDIFIITTLCMYILKIKPSLFI